ncbi:hypothetical protein [Desulfomicrobium escambiense]|uniref:hypothetical protein n=1 Tax=Desulfomicrobium escambiense TaxID=29503 RepID=UPI00041CBB73|nr:hypothetical protein [Desulfomicrobium escambiense]
MHIKINSWLFDKKIQGINASFDMRAGDYVSIAKDILKRNPFQRDRVDTHGKVYALLKNDILEGCVMPPIILSTTTDFNQSNDMIESIIKNGKVNGYEDVLNKIVEDAVSKSEVMILDGLQRTYTLLDSQGIAKSKGELYEEKFNNNVVRFEIYIGLKKSGILYRMLTLNTGQTPMSFRHQIEILYSDYIDKRDLPDGISIIRDNDNQRARGIGKYKYQDVVDMFYAYTTASPKPHDRLSLVNQMKELLFLEEYEGQDDILEMLICYNKFVFKLDELSNGWSFDSSRIENLTRPFGVSVESIFSKSQAMTGFGAEIKKLQRVNQIKNVNDISMIFDGLFFKSSPTETLDSLIVI